MFSRVHISSVTYRTFKRTKYGKPGNNLEEGKKGLITEELNSGRQKIRTKYRTPSSAIQNPEKAVAEAAGTGCFSDLDNSDIL